MMVSMQLCLLQTKSAFALCLTESQGTLFGSNFVKVPKQKFEIVSVLWSYIQPDRPCNN